MPIPITAIVMTLNEETWLPTCLAPLTWADELLVVDSGSTDATAAIAEQHGARVVAHPFQDFASQRNFAQDQAQHDWVLFVDADEELSPGLAENIRALAGSGELAAFNGYFLHRVELLSGRWWPDPEVPTMAAGQRSRAHTSAGMVRLFDRRLGRWERPLHETVSVPPPHGLVNGVMYHYSHTNLSRTYADFNFYTDLEAARLLQAGQPSDLFQASWRGLRSFIYHYFALGLWRFGAQGYLLAVQSGYAKFMNYAKLWELHQIEAGRGRWTEQDRRLLEHAQRRFKLPQ